jgi:predicted XRE-type DNA-binding protein
MDLEQELKQQLARELCAMLHGYNQCNAAGMLGVHQSELSHLRRSQLRRFSIARLLQFISRQAYDVEVHLKAIPQPYAMPRRMPVMTVTRYDRYGQLVRLMPLER